jgi:hypothetical protein
LTELSFFSSISSNNRKRKHQAQTTKDGHEPQDKHHTLLFWGEVPKETVVYKY